MRSWCLVLLMSVVALAQPRLTPVSQEQLQGGRFAFQFGSLSNPPGTSWEMEAETPAERWHYVGVRGERVCHLFVLPPGVADPPSARGWFAELVPETKDYQLFYSEVPLGGSYWMPFKAPDWQGTLVVAHTIPATLIWLDMGKQPTSPEFKEWLKSFRRKNELQSFSPHSLRPAVKPGATLQTRPQRKVPTDGFGRVHRLGSAFTFWPLFLLVALAVRAHRERNRGSYRRQLFLLLLLPIVAAGTLLLLGHHLTQEWFIDSLQRKTAFAYLAYRALGFALLGPLAALLVSRFRPKARRKKAYHSAAERRR